MTARPILRLALGVATVAAVVVALVAALGSADEEQARTDVPAVSDGAHTYPDPPATTGPAPEADNVMPDAPDAPEIDAALNADQTEAGARQAAVAILELTEQAVEMSPEAAAEFQRPLSTRDFADEAAAQTQRQLQELHEAIPEGIKLRLAPIEIRSTPAGDDWIVSIWFVEAITIGTEAVVDDWRTATYTMRWEDSAWKVAAFDSQRGPMPGRGTQPASAPPLQFEAQLEGFDDVGL